MDESDIQHIQEIVTEQSDGSIWQALGLLAETQEKTDVRPRGVAGGDLDSFGNYVTVTVKPRIKHSDSPRPRVASDSRAKEEPKETSGKPEVNHKPEAQQKVEVQQKPVAPGVYDIPQVRAMRKDLEQLAKNITAPEEMKKFLEDMAEFEKRARDQNLPPQEVAKFYKEVGRLFLKDGDNKPVSRDDKIILAEQIMDQAARPTTIDQGYHNTCNVTTVECRLYTRNPSEAARLIADVAISGRFVTRDGHTKVVVPLDSIQKDTEATKNPAPDGDRSFASQVFQVTAVNLHYQLTQGDYEFEDKNGGKHQAPHREIQYEQVSGLLVPPDTGERLYHVKKNKDGTTTKTLITEEPDLTDDGIVRVSNRLTGEKGTGVLVDHVDYVYGDKNGVTTVASVEELEAVIAAAAKNGNLPLIIGLHTGNQPFLHDSGGGTAGGSGGGHVVTVRSYEAARPGPPEIPATVEIDNQWPLASDHLGKKAISVSNLYFSMREPADLDQIKELQGEVALSVAKGTTDVCKNLELLRRRHNLDEMTKDGKPVEQHLNVADFDRAVQKLITVAGKRFERERAEGNLVESEFDSFMEGLMGVLHDQPPLSRLDWIEQMHNVKLLADDQLDSEVAGAVESAFKKWKGEDQKVPPTGDVAERLIASEIIKRLLTDLPPDRRNAIVNSVDVKFQNKLKVILT